MNVDLAVVGGLVVTPDIALPLQIGVRDGRITALVDDARDLQAHELIDAHDRVVFPGVVDPHCHFWEPGPTYREDWETGTRSAAAGGVTTAVEMPLSVPPTVDAAAFQLKQKCAARSAVIDFALWGGIVPASAPDLEARILEQRDLGAVGFKAFMCWSATEFPPVDDGLLFAAMQVLARHDLVLGLHCENDALIRSHESTLRSSGRCDPQAHVESRPEIAEYEAIQRAIILAEATGVRLYIVHMSLPQGAELIRRAKAKGVRVWAETAPRYLALDASAMERSGPFAKCSPPLRSAASQERLWQEVLHGTIDTLGSDHSTFSFEEKEAGREDIWQAPNGLPDIQTAFPLMISLGVHQRGMTLTRLATLYSTNPARIFGLFPRKGQIAIGSDADLTIVDMSATWTIRNEDMLYKHAWSPHDGAQVRGRVERTVARGVTVFQQGEIVGSPGRGRQIMF